MGWRKRAVFQQTQQRFAKKREEGKTFGQRRKEKKLYKKLGGGAVKAPPKKSTSIQCVATAPPPPAGWRQVGIRGVTPLSTHRDPPPREVLGGLGAADASLLSAFSAVSSRASQLRHGVCGSTVRLYRRSRGNRGKLITNFLCTGGRKEVAAGKDQKHHS